jgi:hypothetical protein
VIRREFWDEVEVEGGKADTMFFYQELSRDYIPSFVTVELLQTYT